MPSTTRYVGTVAGPYRVLHRERVDGMTLFRVQCQVCGAKHVVQHQTIIKDIKNSVQNCPECVPRGTHGLCGTPLYNRWAELHHTGRLTPQWDDFEAFLRDAKALGWNDTTGSFRPVNRDELCGPDNVVFGRTVTPAKKWLTIGGVSYTQTDASAILGISKERCRQLFNEGRLYDRLADALEPRSEEIP